MFDDNNLPRGMCDMNASAYSACTYNIVVGWATGGDLVRKIVTDLASLNSLFLYSWLSFQLKLVYPLVLTFLQNITCYKSTIIMEMALQVEKSFPLNNEDTSSIILGAVDNSGVRLYVGNEMRSYDLGGLTFGVHSLPSSLAIPPRVDTFTVDSYCGADASRMVCLSLSLERQRTCVSCIVELSRVGFNIFFVLWSHTFTR